MHRTTFTRLVGVLALTGAAVLTGAGAASAGQPNWSMTVENLPDQVAAGSDAGYQVTITNGGPSNIAKLYLATETNVAADYVDGPPGACSDPGSALTCSFGALRKGQSVTVVVAFPTSVGDSSFMAGFYASSNGATGSDQGHKSHGDFLRPAVPETPTTLVDSPDFAGGFSIAGAAVSTDPTLSESNQQSTTVVPPGGGVVATAQDGLPDDAFSCDPALCYLPLHGEWSSVNVDNGNPQSGLIKITLVIAEDQFPYYQDPDGISLVHVLDDGTTQILDERCGETPTANCIEVTQLESGDWQITAYVTENGGFKGMG